jgi:hypothetical protein
MAKKTSEKSSKRKTSAAKAASKATTKSASKSAPPRAKTSRKAPAKRYATRADKGAPASVALDRMPEPLRSIAWAADAAIRELSVDIDAKVSWGNAGYKVEGHDLFSITAHASYVSVYFGNGALLGPHDQAHLLEGSGKLLRHVKLRAPDEAQSGSFRALLRAALRVAKGGSGNAWNRKKTT